MRTKTILVLLAFAILWSFGGIFASVMCFDVCPPIPEWGTNLILFTIGLPGALYLYSPLNGIVDPVIAISLIAIVLVFLIYFAKVKLFPRL